MEGSFFIMKILFVTQLWKRPEVTRLCFESLRKIPNTDILAVISEDSMVPLCEEYSVKWTYCENLPLGHKHNHALTESLKHEWDYMINVGSDDIVSPKILDAYKPFFKNKIPFFGLSKMHFFGNGKLIRHHYEANYSVYGAGRAISRKMLEEFVVNGEVKLYEPELNKGLDRSSQDIAYLKGFQPETYTGAEPLLVDIKTKVNIWGIKHYEEKSSLLPITELDGYFDQEIITKLLSLNKSIMPQVKSYKHRKYANARMKFTVNGAERLFTFADGVEMVNGMPQISPGVFTTSDPDEQEAIESSSVYNKEIFLIVEGMKNQPAPGQPVVNLAAEIENAVDGVPVDKDFEDISNANIALKAIREKYGKTQSELGNKAQLKEFATEKNIYLPLITLN